MDYFNIDYLSSLFEEDPKSKILNVLHEENSFELPIHYLKDKKELTENIYTDLELLESNDSSNCLYDYVFENDNIKENKHLRFMSKL